MDEYISRKAVMAAYEEEQRKNGPWRFETLIESVPAADVAPVVHGRWVKVTEARVDATGFCSVCGEEAVWRTYKHPYHRCPHCGAKMDGAN